MTCKCFLKDMYALRRAGHIKIVTKELLVNSNNVYGEYSCQQIRKLIANAFNPRIEQNEKKFFVKITLPQENKFKVGTLFKIIENKIYST